MLSKFEEFDKDATNIKEHLIEEEKLYDKLVEKLVK